MELKNRLYSITELCGTYYRLQRIKRRFKVKKRIPDNMFNEAMRQILFHYSRWMDPVSVFEFNLIVLSGRFLADDVFDLEIATGLRNIAGKYIDRVVSDWDDLWYNYFDYGTIPIVQGGEEMFTLNEWFDLSNIDELHFHEDNIVEIDVESLYEWMLWERPYKTCSLLSCSESSLFVELSRWPFDIFNTVYLDKNHEEFYKIKGTVSTNHFEQLWVLYRVMRYFSVELKMENIVPCLKKHWIPFDLEYIERLRPYVFEFEKLLKSYPHML